MKRVAVTGVSRGLGAALVDELISRGHRVAGCARSAAAMAALADRHGSAHAFAAVDVTDDAAVARWAEDLIARVGVPDLLINNAAVVNRPAPLWEIDAAELREVLDTNVAGTVNVIRHLLPRMIAAGGGTVVNLSSGWGRSTAPGVAPYCATKWAIEGLSQALAQEVPDGVAVVALNPGIIDTAMLRRCWGDEAAAFGDATAWARRAAPFLLALGPPDNGRSATAPGG